MSGPDKIWIDINCLEGLWYKSNNGGPAYTRTDLCIPPSEADALRAENIALLEALNAGHQDAYDKGVKDAADKILLLQQYDPQCTRGDGRMYPEDGGGWVDLDDVEAIFASLLSKHTKGGE